MNQSNLMENSRLIYVKLWKVHLHANSSNLAKGKLSPRLALWKFRHHRKRKLCEYLKVSFHRNKRKTFTLGEEEKRKIKDRIKVLDKRLKWDWIWDKRKVFQLRKFRFCFSLTWKQNISAFCLILLTAFVVFKVVFKLLSLRKKRRKIYHGDVRKLSGEDARRMN